MFRSAIVTTMLAGCLLAVGWCVVSCRKSLPANELALREKTAAPAPSAANVIKIDQNSSPRPGPGGTERFVSSAQSAIINHWLMLAGILIVLFLLSLVLFHTMGRRLRRRAFKVHSPTRHVDIWASHKPPEFLDP